MTWAFRMRRLSFGLWSFLRCKHRRAVVRATDERTRSSTTVDPDPANPALPGGVNRTVDATGAGAAVVMGRRLRSRADGTRRAAKRRDQA